MVIVVTQPQITKPPLPISLPAANSPFIAISQLQSCAYAEQALPSRLYKESNMIFYKKNKVYKIKELIGQMLNERFRYRVLQKAAKAG